MESVQSGPRHRTPLSTPECVFNSRRRIRVPAVLPSLLYPQFVVRQLSIHGLVNQRLKGKITWSRISWGPLPWRIKILEPVLRSEDGKPVITAQTVAVDDFRLMELLKGNIAADNITIQSPVVRIVGIEQTESERAKRPDR